MFGVLVLLCVFATPALAGPPSHTPLPASDIVGLDHACGTAVDSEGDVYASSAGQSQVKVFSPDHELLATIAESNEPCGLAVDSAGTLYVSERATGNVVKFTPNVYPLTGSPTYGSPQSVDSSGKATGIAVDQFDDRLYVAEGDRVAVFQADGTTGEDEVQGVQVDTPVTGGTFTLEFEGQATGPIPYNATPAQVQSALEPLSTIGAGNVAVDEGFAGVRSYLVTFTHSLGSQDVPAMSPSGAGLSGGGVHVSASANGAHAGYAFDGHIAEGELGNATAVAAYTSPGEPSTAQTRERYLYIADSETNQIAVLHGLAVNALQPQDAIDGGATPAGSFGFGAEGAALGLDWSNGHLFVYDAAHQVVDEFEADGEYLDQFASASFSDAGPTGIAVVPRRSAVQELEGIGNTVLGYEGAQTTKLPSEPNAADVQGALEALPGIGAGNVSVQARRQVSFGDDLRFIVTFTGALADRRVGRITVDPAAGRVVRVAGSGPGRVYVSAGAGAGAKVLAFTGLAPPSRSALPDLSRKLASARVVATDSNGYVYVVAGALIHVYRPDGSEVKVGAEGKGIEDPNEPQDLAVDSTGRVYTNDNYENSTPATVTYYTPSSYPPDDGTTYGRHEPPIVTSADIPAGEPYSIAVNPADDHLLVSGFNTVMEFDSAANGSDPIREVAPGLTFGYIQSLGVYGANGDIYLGQNPRHITVINAAGTKRLAEFNGANTPAGPVNANPQVTVDQSNGHVIIFSMGGQASVVELDPTGSFVAEYGSFTDSASPKLTDVAVDNSGGPGDGNVYVAYDDPNLKQPFDVFAFSPLSYGEPPLAVTGGATEIGGGNATLNGAVSPRGFSLSECTFEYLTDAEYAANGNTFAGAASLPCSESLASIGSGSNPVPVHVALSGLEPETRYRFRLLAANEFGPSEGEAGLFGPPVLTLRSALPVLFDEATLRAKVDPSGLATKYHFDYGTSESYAQSTEVSSLAAGESPVDVDAVLTGLEERTVYHFRVVAENEAGVVTGPDQTFTTLGRLNGESCENGAYRGGFSGQLPDCRAYELVTPAETNGLTPTTVGVEVNGFNNWLVTPRGPGAGERLSYFTLGTLPGFDGNGDIDGYRAVRAPGAHPASGWVNQLFGPTYRQSIPDFTHEVKQRSVSSDQAYSFWIVNPVQTTSETLPPGSVLQTPVGFEQLGVGALGTDPSAAGWYISPGGSHVVFASEAHLEDEAAPAGTTAVYDRAAGQANAVVISLKPDGSAFGAGEDASYVGSSEDGSTVLFKVGGTLYARAGGTTTEVAAAPNSFAGLASDGGRVFYAATANGAAPAGLFECDIAAGPCAGPEVQQAPTELAAAASFALVSQDGSSALFVSEVALPESGQSERGEIAEAGMSNLYVWDSGIVQFIAQIDPADVTRFTNWAGNGLMDGSSHVSVPTRSTPDGGVFVFASHAQLTDYDNEGSVEIYRYDPAAEQGRMLCVSCDPSGAPPSADASFAQSLSAHTIVPNVTDDGDRVFFESPDRLVPEDANSVVDVYEWLAPGVGGCERSTGCPALISSGQGESASQLFSMSADGRDLFFITRDRLVGGDIVGSPSLYDARVNGGIPEPPPAAPCQGDACQGGGSESPVLPSPVTTGPSDGNVPSHPPHCRKGRHRVHGRCVPKKHRRRHKHSKSHRHQRPSGNRLLEVGR